MTGPISPLALVDLLGALTAGALWYARPELGAWPLLIALVSLGVRHVVLPQPALPRTGLTAALGLFLVSAGVGLLIAYDRSAALSRFYLILAAGLLYAALLRAPQQVAAGRLAVAPRTWLVALLPTLVAVYFILTADYAQPAGKFAILDPLFAWLARRLPAMPLDRLNGNIAGGLIAGLLPLQLAAVRRRPMAWGLPALAVLGLILTASRGAWAAVALVGVAAGVLAGVRGRQAMRSRAASAVVAIVLLGFGSFAAALPVHPVQAWAPAAPHPANAAPAMPSAEPRARADVAPRAASQVEPPLPPAPPRAAPLSLAARASLWRDAAGLAWDYAFTGLGLAGFQMAYSTYSLLVHVGHTNHAHNLFLDVWLEQGLVGLAALVWLLAAATLTGVRLLRSRPLQDSPGAGTMWTAAALASVAIIGLHGLVDDAFYASRGVVFLFVPFGVLAAEQAATGRVGRPEPIRHGWMGRPGQFVAAGAVILLLLALLTPVRSQAQANLGALSQTRAELSVYRWPAWPIQDELRRSPAVDLGPAIAHYEQALALDPGNATANRRLGQIALARGDYASAGAYLAAAYRNDYANRPTRQMYGEWLAIDGQADAAAALWRTLTLDAGQIPGRIWWFQHIGRPELAAALQAADRLR